MNRTTLVLDSSQISTFLECPKKWQLSYSEHLTSSTEVREEMMLGTFGHKLLEIYYTKLALGSSVQNAVKAVAEFDPNKETCECNHLHTQHDRDYLAEAEPCTSYNCGCRDFIGAKYPLSEEKQKAVRDRFQVYWMTYCSKDIEPLYHKTEDEVIPFVEQGFSYELVNDENRLYVLEGRIDLLGTMNGLKLVMDHKFQGRSYQLYKKSIQFRNYSLVADVPLVMINYIRMHKEVTKDTLERAIVSFNEIEKQQWKQRLISIYDRIAAQISEGPEMNPSACAGKFGSFCEFIKICEEPNEFVQIAMKEQHYHKKVEWKPWD